MAKRDPGLEKPNISIEDFSEKFDIPERPTSAPLAKVGDPISHHKDSYISKGDPTVMICGRHAARILDEVICTSPHHHKTRICGPCSPNVIIHDRPAAVIGDFCFPCDSPCSQYYDDTEELDESAGGSGLARVSDTLRKYKHLCDELGGVICPSPDSYRTTGAARPRKPQLPDFLDKVKDQVDDVSGMIAGVTDKVKGKLADVAADKVTGKLGDVVDKVSDKAKGKLGGVGDNIADKVAGKVKGKLGDVVNDVAGKITKKT